MFIVIVARLATARLRGLATETWRSILGLGDFPDRRILLLVDNKYSSRSEKIVLSPMEQLQTAI